MHIFWISLFVLIGWCVLAIAILISMIFLLKKIESYYKNLPELESKMKKLDQLIEYAQYRNSLEFQKQLKINDFQFKETEVPDQIFNDEIQEHIIDEFHDLSHINETSINEEETK